ncbi:MAG: BatD family protein [Cytophagales bacterium]|nr:BatD family protein [Cytophaga sp.]
MNLALLSRIVFILFIWSAPFISLNSQTISFKSNKTTLHKNDFLSISITFSKDAKKEFNAYKTYQFPDIPDMEKSHTYFNDKENGEKTFSIVQWYEPIKAGGKNIPAITVQTRNKAFTNPAFSISVLSETTDNPAEPPAEPWIGKTKLQYTEPDVHWQINTDVQEVYPLQPIHIRGYILLPLDNKTPFTFVDSHIQQQAISKQVKNSSCMIYDDMKAKEYKKDTIVKDEKKFLQLTIIDQFLFPLKASVIQLPATEWYVYGYKTGVNDEGVVRLPERVVLKAPGFKIKVKPLPPYTTKEIIPIGTFYMKDYLEQKRIHNGNATFLHVILETNTDLSSVGELEFLSSDMEVLSEETIGLTVLEGDQWRVRKEIRYQINPLRTGQYAMSEAFRFVYFNTKKNQYDTIYPKSILNVYGDRLSESNAMLTNDDFYNRYNSQATSMIINGTQDDLFNRLANLIILVMLAVTATLVIKK